MTTKRKPVTGLLVGLAVVSIGLALGAVIGLVMPARAETPSRRTAEALAARGLSAPGEAARPTPTPRPGRKPVSVPKKTPRRVPKDIPAHLGFGPVGGGGEGCLNNTTPMTRTADSPARKWQLPYAVATWCYSGLTETSGQVLTASLTTPAGTSELLFATTADSGSDIWAAFTYTFPMTTPQAVHTFTVSLSGHVVTDVFVPEVGQVDMDQWLPNEPVRLIVFAFSLTGQSPDTADQPPLSFTSNLYTRADPDGTLRVQVASDGDLLDGTGLYLFAVGKTSPCRTLIVYPENLWPNATCAVAALGDNYIRTWTYSRAAPVWLYWQPCRAAPRSQLRRLDFAEVQRVPSVPLYARPNSNARVTGQLSEREVVRVVGGPVCAGGRVWWQVQRQDSRLTGWTIEGETEENPVLGQVEPVG